jgi:Mg-chelatase subunit ChlD
MTGKLKSIMKNISRSSLVLFLAVLFSTTLTFAQGEKKAAYGILLDNTGTMFTQIETVKTLGKALAQDASKRGIVSVFNFETQGEIKDTKSFLAVATSGTEWSQDKNAIEKYIDGLKVARGQTTLWDAIRSMAKATDEKAKIENLPEKIIILITDGEDRASEVTDKQLIKELKESGVKVYAIGLTQELDSGLNFGSSEGRSKKYLKKFTKETGGNAIFPKLKKETKVDDLLIELFAEQSNKK